MKTATQSGLLLLFDDVPASEVKPLVMMPEHADNDVVWEDGRPVVYLPIARFQAGTWDNEKQKTVNVGELSKSFSLELISNGTIRKSTRYKNRLIVGTSRLYSGGGYEELYAYEVIPLEAFHGQTYTYAEKAKLIESNEAERRMFHHGVRVKQGGQEWVMVGPPITFKPSDVERQIPEWRRECAA